MAIPKLMTVAELITELQKFPQESRVIIGANDMDAPPRGVMGVDAGGFTADLREFVHGTDTEDKEE